MNPTNQMSMVLENELNNAQSVFPVNVKNHSQVKIVCTKWQGQCHLHTCFNIRVAAFHRA